MSVTPLPSTRPRVERANEQSVLTKLQSTRTPVQFVLEDGSSINGTITWFDIGNVAVIEPGRDLVTVIAKNRIQHWAYDISATV